MKTENFTLKFLKMLNVRRFHMYGKKLEFVFNTVTDKKDPIDWIKTGIEEIFNNVIQHVELNDKTGVTFGCQSFQERGPASNNFKYAKDFDTTEIWEVIAKNFQSDSEGLSRDTFCLNVTYVRLPTGTGRGEKYNNFEEAS